MQSHAATHTGKKLPKRPKHIDEACALSSKLSPDSVAAPGDQFENGSLEDVNIDPFEPEVKAGPQRVPSVPFLVDPVIKVQHNHLLC